MGQMRNKVHPTASFPHSRAGTRQNSQELLRAVCPDFPSMVHFDGEAVSEIKASQDGLKSVYIQVLEYHKRCLLLNSCLYLHPGRELYQHTWKQAIIHSGE